MKTESVEIPDRQAKFIQEIITAGRYESVSEVVRAGVVLLEERLAHEERQREKLRKMLDEAIAGGLSDRTPEEIWDEAEARYFKDNA